MTSENTNLDLELEPRFSPELDLTTTFNSVVKPDFLPEGVEVIGLREGGIIDCWVPAEHIDHEEVPVKQEWVDSLASDMAKMANRDGGSGQLTPIILGQIEGEDKLKIIDGFHRDAALVKNGATKLYCSVLQTDWDGLFDTRIFTAKDHAHVRFSRVVQWIREVWDHSGLSDKLSVEQAVLLYRFDSSGKNLGLDEEEADLAKAWVAKKEEQWQMKSMTIHSHLKVAENVDPLLVHATREKKGGRSLEAPTQAIIKIFSEELPSRFDLQNFVMEVAMAQNMKGPHVKALCKTVSNCESVDEARSRTANIDWENWEPAFGETKDRQLRRKFDPRHNGGAVILAAGGDISKMTERVKRSISGAETVTPEMLQNLAETKRRIRELTSRLGGLTMSIDELIEMNLPEPEGEQKHLAHHKNWGLDFRVYEDERAPVVHIDGRGQFGMPELEAVVLYLIAQQEPKTTIESRELIPRLSALGFSEVLDRDGKAVRIAIREIIGRLKAAGKDEHICERPGAQKQVNIGLY